MTILSFSREDLLKPIQLVAGVVGRQQTKPILSHILLIARENSVTFIGSDSEIELSASIKLAQALPTPIELTLPGKKFLDICRALPENSIIELTPSNNNMIVAAGKSRFSLATLAAQDFPRTLEHKEVMEFKIKQGELRNLIDKTAFSIPQQDVRQYLNGLLLEVKGGTIKSLATDGHRLAMSSITSSAVADFFAQVIIPRKAVFELLRLLENSEEITSIGFNDNYVKIQSNRFTLLSKLISGKFPNYSKIIPSKGNKIVKLQRELLKQALVRVGILSSELLRSVRLQLRPNLLTLTTNNPEHEEASEELEIAYKGEKLNTVFNINYLIDIVNTIAAEDINIFFKSGESGAIVEGIDSDQNCLYAIMPIRSQ